MNPPYSFYMWQTKKLAASDTEVPTTVSSCNHSKEGSDDELLSFEWIYDHARDCWFRSK